MPKKLEINAGGSVDKVSELPPTKRSCLKRLAAVLDPLCLICSLIIIGKILFQDTWARELDWDDTSPADMKAMWLRWTENLLRMSSLTVTRSIHPFLAINAQ